VAGVAVAAELLDDPLSDLVTVLDGAELDDPDDSDDDPPAELPASALVLAGVADFELSRLSVR
jgi:hypothetical protein